ncbi:MAG TPA: peptidoglycan-associated lipoprotein Pal [Quisquiliibacterium sp.]|jgi:peptidoglycan-associated lipoprotein|nr:peptidoglycan-associated lipoprotein Pal [Quisquiliibacterium sp.]
MKTIRQFLMAAGIALALAGCGSSVKLDENGAGAPVDARTGDAQGAAADASGAGSRQVTPVTVDPRAALNDPAGPLAKRSIYFDFDSFTIRDEFRGTVEAHARFLNENKGIRVVIQGNTDERGTREYNLALGQKRAEAVRRALSALGVAEGQMEAVSFGEEKPRATGSDESAFAENRRADLAYQ